MVNSLADPWGGSRVIWSGEAFLAPSDFIVLVVRLSLALCYVLL